MKIILMLNLLLVTSLFAKEGGWVGSGGELFKDAHNPWFLKNTKVIKYCVQLDTKSFSTDLNIVEKEINTAFSYWINEFKKAGYQNQNGRFDLGGQRIIKEKCHKNTDLIFKLGYGTLNKAEINHLVKPEKYIGVTIRKNYSVETLKGDGIIYISSDIGPHKYENPDGNLFDKAWERPKLLRFALIHELGHVFGIPHSGNSIMSQIFLDQMLNKYLVDAFMDLPIDSFLQPDDNFESCTIDRKIKTFVFRMKASEDCLRVKKINDGEFELFALTTQDKKERKIGTLSSLFPVLWDINSRPASVLQITNAQKVFTPAETGFRSFMYGPLIQDQGYKATLMIDGTLPKSVYVKIRSTSFALYGEYKKKIEPLVITQSPLSLLLLKDPIQ